MADISHLGVLAAKGFRAGAVSCGLKRGRKLDLGLIAADSPAAAAAVFTKNSFASPAVHWSRRVARRGKAQAIVVNAGNANACTGKRGYSDARRMAELAAKLTRARPGHVFVASTGIIGHPLDMAKVRDGIEHAAQELGTGRVAAGRISRAIMTTDKRPKAAAARCKVGGVPVVVGGIAKGSGMISPDMATMLCFLTTDAAIKPKPLAQALERAVGASFNRITVDGDSSTNDTVAIMASGAAGNKPIAGAGPREYAAFERLLCEVTQTLALDIVRDGEGATKLIRVNVSRAASKKAAERVARTIANSPLVKTAIYGGDPNWGRIICAVGYSGVPVDTNRVRLKIGGITVFERGSAKRVRQSALKRAVQRNDVTISVELGTGSAGVSVWTCDLSHEYVTINSQYHT